MERILPEIPEVWLMTMPNKYPVDRLVRFRSIGWYQNLSRRHQHLEIGNVLLFPVDFPIDQAKRLVVHDAWRTLMPWLRPDRNPMPHFDLFPRLTRLARKLRRA